VKVHLGGQRFQTDNELKHGIWNWLWSKDKTFYTAGTSNLPWGRGENKYVSVKGE
jgi:hypothetical protein